MLTKAKKRELVEELSDKLSRQKITIFADFHGISVAKSQGLRRLLKKAEAEYKVAKKTLLDLALKNFGTDLKAKQMPGELGVTFGFGDLVSPAKTLIKFSKENETFKIVGGFLGSRILTDKDVMALAKLPAREVLIAQLLGAFNAPLRGLVRVLQGNMYNLVVVLQKISARGGIPAGR